MGRGPCFREFKRFALLAVLGGEGPTVRLVLSRQKTETTYVVSDQGV